MLTQRFSPLASWLTPSLTRPLRAMLLSVLLIATLEMTLAQTSAPHPTIAPHASTRPEIPLEIHQRIVGAPEHKMVALTLDACSGKFDADLIEFLIRNHIPATVFATKKWLDVNPAGIGIIKAHADLFEVEDHGENHIPAVIGAGRRVYGILGEPDIAHLRKEVQAGAQAVADNTGHTPHWYRGATAEYDAHAVQEIQSMGYQIAGFSVNADAGATLSRAAIARRLQQVRANDIIIAHMNKPASDSAEGLSTGLLELLKRGFQFVRLDQVNVQSIR